MPILEAPPYLPPLHLRQRDLHTIVPALRRKIKDVSYDRHRLELADGDFLDLDFSKGNTGDRPIAVITHGLEGSSTSQYAKGTVRALNAAGMDAVVLNLRGCSGEPNRLYISYHSGKSDDLDHTVNYLIDQRGRDRVFLTGYSLGGNLSLKYAGERGGAIRSEIKGVVAVSAPTDLVSTCYNLQRRRNWVYLKNFMVTLKKKAIHKLETYPDEATFTREEVQNANNFIAYDNLYTAPAHGFKDALDYYQSCQSGKFIADIRVPAYLINAQNDPFLTPECFPFEEAEKLEFFHLMAPKHGGHVGFVNHWRLQGNSWIEDRMVEILQGLGA